MSLLEKLKELVATVEEERPGAQESDFSEEEEEEEWEEEEEAQEEEPESEAVEETPDYIECTEEEKLQVVQSLQVIKSSKISLADLTMQFESNKQLVLKNIETKYEEIRKLLSELKEKYEVPDEGYSVSVPDTPDEKLFFVKRQD